MEPKPTIHEVVHEEAVLTSEEKFAMFNMYFESYLLDVANYLRPVEDEQENLRLKRRVQESYRAVTGLVRWLCYTNGKENKEVNR